MTHQAKLDEIETRMKDLLRRHRSDTPRTGTTELAERGVARAVFNLLKRDGRRIDRFVEELQRLRSNEAM